MDQPTKKTLNCAEVKEHSPAVFANAILASLDASANVQQSRVSIRASMIANVDTAMILKSNAVEEDFANAVNAIATLVRTPRKRSTASSANATTFLAIETTEFSVQDRIMEFANAVNVNVTMDGAAMLASVLHHWQTVLDRTEKFAPTTVNVFAESVNATSMKASDLLVSTATNAQHVLAAATSSKTASNVNSTRKDR